MVVNYSKWDRLAASLDEGAVEAAPALPPWAAAASGAAEGPALSPTDPSRVAAMRNLLDEIDDARRPHLLLAIEWLERASKIFGHGEVPSDGDCPFNQGDPAWYWFCLLANKPHVTLHGPYRPLLARYRTAREQCVVEGLCQGRNRAIPRRFNLAVFRARAFEEQRPCFETVPRDDHSSKNQPKRVENDRDMSL